MTTTQEERIFGGLAHLGALFGWYGLAFQIILLVIFQPKSRFISSHVKQALGLWVSFFVFRMVVGVLFFGGIGMAVATNPFRLLQFGGAIMTILLGALLVGAFGLVVLVLVILAMAKGLNGQTYRYPLIGDLVASITGEQA